jgi:hypothetical protein
LLLSHAIKNLSLPPLEWDEQVRPRLQRHDPFSKSCINIAGSQVIPNRDGVRLDEARCPLLPIQLQPISMQEIVKRALKVTKESKHIEFKRGFDPLRVSGAK